MFQVPHIDDCPALCASLGKPAVDRIRNHITNKNTIGGPRTRWVANPFQEYLDDLEAPSVPAALEDIFVGVARTDQDGSKSLSAHRLFVLLACNKRVSTDLIQSVMNIDARQARRYMAAARLAIYLLHRKLSAPPLVRRSPTLTEIRHGHTCKPR